MIPPKKCALALICSPVAGATRSLVRFDLACLQLLPQEFFEVAATRITIIIMVTPTAATTMGVLMGQFYRAVPFSRFYFYFYSNPPTLALFSPSRSLTTIQEEAGGS
ncbi:hypothetical protein TYRP_009322 [Tyrophagus putrescentiae]|nr:hypothetical protein TYRP_009322 [Tyrophagus putrescentiae]